MGEMKMAAGIKVDGYSGYKANQRPLAFSLGKKMMKVKAILDQWYGPDHTYFKVVAEDANIYILKYSEANDQWELVFFKVGDYNGEVSPGLEKHASS